MLKKVAALRRAVRWREWYASKLPFVWTALGLAASRSALETGAILERAVAVIVFTCVCGAFGHLANDHADRAGDRLAQVRRPIAALRPAAARLAIAAVAGAGLAILALASLGTIAAAAGIATLALATAYSLPPLRLKGRGAWGVWSAAAAQRTLPVLFAFASLGALTAESWALAAAAQLLGIRAMLVHQLGDVGNDRRAGIATYVAVAGEERARRLVRRVVVPLELAALAALLWIASAHLAGAWAIAAAGALACAVWAALPHDERGPYSLDGFDRQPLAGFYQAILPLGVMILLCLSRPPLWPLGVAFLVWEASFIAGQLARSWTLFRGGGEPR